MRSVAATQPDLRLTPQDAAGPPSDLDALWRLGAPAEAAAAPVGSPVGLPVGVAARTEAPVPAISGVEEAASVHRWVLTLLEM